MTEIMLNSSKVEDYFKVDDSEKIKGPRFDSKMQIIPHSVVGPSNLFDTGRKRLVLRFSRLTSMNGGSESESRKTTHRTSSIMFNAKNSIIAQGSLKNKNYEAVSSEVVDKMYEKFQISRNSSEKNEKLPNIPTNLKSALNIQENFFKTFHKHEKKTLSLSNFISIKVKKKEEDLLMNKSPAQRLKTELIDLVGQQRPKGMSVNLNTWMNTLRRDNTSSRNIYGLEYYNTGTDQKPFWISHVSHNQTKSTDIVRPCFMEKSIPSVDKYVKSKYVTDIGKKYGIDMNKLLNPREIKIEGRNLLDEEMKETKKIKGKMVIFKAEIQKNENCGTEVIKKDYHDKIKRKLLFNKIGMTMTSNSNLTTI